MRIPRFWATDRFVSQNPRTGQPERFDVRGWSFDSAEAAQADAARRKQRLAERLRAGTLPEAYGYFDRPIREEILETLSLEDEPHALITRNHYGALVLNSARVMFADVDFPTAKARGPIDRLHFALSRGRRLARQSEEDRAVWDRIRGWAEANSTRSFRLYRTLRGLRLLMTDRLYEPTARETTALLESMGADPRYVKLTQAQECFRARLSPKPERCGFRRPPHRFPFEGREIEERVRQWEREYAARAAAYRACEFVGDFGAAAGDATIGQTIEVHDRHACAAEGAPLA